VNSAKQKQNKQNTKSQNKREQERREGKKEVLFLSHRTEAG